MSNFAEDITFCTLNFRKYLQKLKSTIKTIQQIVWSYSASFLLLQRTIFETYFLEVFGTLDWRIIVGDRVRISTLGEKSKSLRSKLEVTVTFQVDEGIQKMGDLFEKDERSTDC